MPTLGAGAQARGASGQFTVRLDTSRLVNLMRNLPVRSRQTVDDNALAIRDLAQQLAPRDTGSLAVSLYVTNGETSGYTLASSAAAARNPAAVIVPEVRPEFVLSLFGSGGNAYVSAVASAVGHAAPQEFGTVHMGAQPFLIPAIEAFRDPFISDMGHVADT